VKLILEGRSQYTIKFKVDINFDDPQRHDTSRKKLNFKPDYILQIKPNGAMAIMPMKGLYMKIYTSKLIF
jgi:hypothetical protein